MFTLKTSNQKSVRPFPEQLMQMLTGHYVSQGIYIAAKLRIADLLKDGAKTIAQAIADYFS